MQYIMHFGILCVLLDQWDFLPVFGLVLSLAVVEHPLVLVQVQYVDLVWVDHDQSKAARQWRRSPSRHT